MLRVGRGLPRRHAAAARRAWLTNRRLAGGLGALPHRLPVGVHRADRVAGDADERAETVDLLMAPMGMIVSALLATLVDGGPLLTIIGTVAVALATINVVGGYAVTNRMLEMFKKKDDGGAK